MQTQNIHQAKLNLSSLVDKALAGEEVVISCSSNLFVKLVPYIPTIKPRKPGLLKGKIQIPDNFDEITVKFT